MDWLEDIPARARLAFSVGGAAMAGEASLLPEALQLIALGTGMALCAYGIGASMGPLLKSKATDRLEEERRRDFERQQQRLTEKFRNLRRDA